jgi:HPt (histidine-containing phosphotransfer) domain-containing protein
VLARHAGDDIATPPPAAPEHGHCIDHAYLNTLVEALGAAKVRQLVADFPGYARGHRAELASGCAAGDVSAIRGAAHALHGMAANLGLARLADITGTLEEVCAADGKDAALLLCDQVEATLDATLSELGQVVLEEPPASGP